MPCSPRALLGAVLIALALPVSAAAAPTFSNYPGPPDLAGDAGEPSIGYHTATNATLFQAYTNTLKVSNFDGAGTATWSNVSDPASVISLDPILWTDRDTGRTLQSQLLLACSQAGFTDDDGATWDRSQGCGVGTVTDHQTIGGGPWHAPAPALASYPHAVYYCTQDSVQFAHCATSLDGGRTFGPATQPYSADRCPLLLHGHIKVAPDGTVYLPTADCHGRQTLAVSRDNGSTWTLDEATGSTTQDESDPHLGIGDKGTLYFGWQGADGQDLGDRGYAGHAFTEGHPWISVKPTGSSQWRAPVDVGASLGIKNIQFPEVFAGDDGRAAFAFLGTTTAGDDQDPTFAGVWHLYVAYTYDQGLSWTTVDATANDPVQRGCIWLQGGSSNCRNLLDFNDITMDRSGRVLVAYADGCTGACVGNPANKTKTALGTIARQESGLGLLAASDPVLSAAAPVQPVATSAAVSAPAATRLGGEDPGTSSQTGSQSPAPASSGNTTASSGTTSHSTRAQRYRARIRRLCRHHRYRHRHPKRCHRVQRHPS